MEFEVIIRNFDSSACVELSGLLGLGFVVF